MRKISRIILHHTAIEWTGKSQLGLIDRIHRERWGTGIGYHVLIQPEGEIFSATLARPFPRIGAHARGNNSDSIGIALAGNFSLIEPSPELISFTAATIVQLARTIITHDNPELFKTISDRVFPHNALSKTECPGSLFSWDELVNQIYDINPSGLYI